MEEAQVESQPTMGEVSQTANDTVGLSKFLDEKNKRKEAEALAQQLQYELDQARTMAQQGASQSYVDDTVNEIAQKYTDVSPELLRDLVSVTKREIDKEYGSKLNAFEADRQREAAEKKFSDLYTRTISDMPEYSNMVNPEVIKSLAFNPMNANKTLPQIIEETYGRAIVGRKTLETSGGSSRRDNAGDIDFANMRDSDWEAIEADPALKAKHNAWTMEQLNNL